MKKIKLFLALVFVFAVMAGVAVSITACNGNKVTVSWTLEGPSQMVVQALVDGETIASDSKVDSGSNVRFEWTGVPDNYRLQIRTSRDGEPLHTQLGSGNWTVNDVTENMSFIFSAETQHTITFNNLEGGSANNPAIFYASELDPSLTLAPATRDGNWAFRGWYSNQSFEGQPVTAVTTAGNVTLWARWGTWSTITTTQAYNMFNTLTEEFIILDVRNLNEWHWERLDGSTLIPYTELAGRANAELPNRDAIILIYCRAGRRSAIAAATLAGLGYTRVYDFGGINLNHGVPDQWPYSGIVHSEVTIQINTVIDATGPHGFSFRLESQNTGEIISLGGTGNSRTATVRVTDTIRVFVSNNATFGTEVEVESYTVLYSDYYSGTGEYAYFDINIVEGDMDAPIVINFVIVL